MHKIVSPLCLVLALAMLVAGFALWSVEPPQASVELHRARVEGDEAFTDVLEAQLRRRTWVRRGMLAGLFGGSVAMTVAAFLLMRPAEAG